eukprot:CAMPEP_0179418114 /NCGR_PEP_ID=MMETSP0799-20121207/7774_1 /TAXON_ID=46947 /ORGANISM="Geminigera cryophila, Strain CCMP2564" /LENGTH=56 /DNA_ID=CAMNT_0021191261 /DNA_START=315 /DNA_END=485 /DNA_ORIENTATION=-
MPLLIQLGQHTSTLRGSWPKSAPTVCTLPDADDMPAQMHVGVIVGKIQVRRVNTLG